MSDHANPVLRGYGIRLLEDLGQAATFAAEAAARSAIKAMRKKRPAGKTRQPGVDSPMWNVLRSKVKASLASHGAKTRIARHLGLPKQRLSDFLNGRRIPDGEIMLQLLFWLTEHNEGRAPDALMPDANPESTRKRLQRAKVTQ